ncbi:MAG: TetR/AcrR family transcriptional regulator [Solirubrobacterales bacterium]
MSLHDLRHSHASALILRTSTARRAGSSKWHERYGHQHFKSKHELLEAAIEHELAAMGGLSDALAMLPLGDFRADLTLLARWNLASLDRRADLTRFIRREAHLLPKRMRTRLYESLVAKPYAEITAWLESRYREAGIDPPDLAALSLILIESMAAYKELAHLFGRIPGEIDDERFVDAWVEIGLTVAGHHGLSSSR